MLFLSNHQDLATVLHLFRPNLHSLPHPRFPPCLHLPLRTFSPRFPSTSRSPSHAHGSLLRRRTVFWVPSRLSHPKPCSRTMKSQHSLVLKPHRSVRFTTSCSHFRQDPPHRRNRCTRIHRSWCRRCTRRSWRQPPQPSRRDKAQATCRRRFRIRTRQCRSNRRGQSCNRRSNSCSNINNSFRHEAKWSLLLQVRYLEVFLTQRWWAEIYSPVSSTA